MRNLPADHEFDRLGIFSATSVREEVGQRFAILRLSTLM
jgi:hypothetical protein